MSNPFDRFDAQPASANPFDQFDVVPVSQTRPALKSDPSVVDDPALLARLNYDLDVTGAPETVRAAIAKMPAAQQDGALRHWADHFVAKERAAGGIGQGIDNTVRAFTRGTLVGSFLDEANAATSALANTVTGGAVGSSYDESVAYQRAKDRAFDKANPVTSTALQVGGGVASFVPLLKPAQTFVGGMLRGGSVGSVAGYTHGFGEGEGSIAARHGKGKEGAVVGGMLGALIPPAVTVGARGLGILREKTQPGYQRVFGGGADEAANVIMAQRMRASGVTPQDIATDLQRGEHAATFNAGSHAQLPEMIADSSDAMQRLAGSVYRAGGEGAETLRRALDDRQWGPRNRLARDLDPTPSGQMDTMLDAFDRAMLIASKGQARAVERTMLERMEKAGARNYNQARANSEPFDLSDALTAFRSAAGEHAAPMAARMQRAANLFETTGVQGGTRNPVNTVERFDNAKKALDDMIEGAQRNGQNNLVRELTGFKRGLLDAVHAADPKGAPTINLAYHNARATWGSAAENRGVIEQGRQSFNDPVLAAEIFGRLSDGQQRLFRIGMREALQTAFSNIKPGQDVTQFFQKRGVSDLMGKVIPVSKGGTAVFADRAERFGDYVNRQSRMVDTRKQALGGSPTAGRQLDDSQLTGEVMRTWWDKMKSSTSAFNLATETIGHVFQRTLGMQQEVATAMARRLTATDPAERARILQDLERRLGPDKFRNFLQTVEREVERVTMATTNTAVGPSPPPRTPPVGMLGRSAVPQVRAPNGAGLGMLRDISL